MRAEVRVEGGQALADVDCGEGVVVEAVKVLPDGGWEVWGVRLDGRLYREPRDLQGDSLADGPFREMLNEALYRAEGG